MNGRRRTQLSPIALVAIGMTVVAFGCQGQQNVAPDWSWAPGSGAKIAPPQTGRGAYGSPDPYYRNAPRNTSVDRDRDESYARRDADDRLIERDDYPVSQANYDRDADSSLKFRGMPKSGEPRRFDVDRDLVELTELPESRFGLRVPRTAATIMTPNSRSKRTPTYRDDDRGYDEDYRAASSTENSRWRRRE